MSDEETARLRERDRARMKRAAGIHFVMVMGALTLWGASDAWAISSGWGLAWAVSIANALIAGTIIANTLHEWGHFAGARLSGAVSPVLKKPVRHYFMFDFSFDENDDRQFLWMSWGGILIPWILVALAALLVPIDNLSRIALLATLLTRAVQVSVFEVPVVLRTRRGGEPRAELDRELESGFARSRWAGFAVGAVGALVWLAA
jgi:hypothetical protein